MVPSRYSTKNPCNQSSQSICYSILTEQQRERAECTSKSEDTDRKRIMVTSTDKLWMHTYGNWQEISQEKQIKTKLADIAFEVFNADRTKNREITQFVPLEVEINRYKEQINAAITNLNGTDIFLGHN